jgi:hypothetical protein
MSTPCRWHTCSSLVVPLVAGHSVPGSKSTAQRSAARRGAAQRSAAQNSTAQTAQRGMSGNSQLGRTMNMYCRGHHAILRSSLATGSRLAHQRLWPQAGYSSCPATQLHRISIAANASTKKCHQRASSASAQLASVCFTHRLLSNWYELTIVCSSHIDDKLFQQQALPATTVTRAVTCFPGPHAMPGWTEDTVVASTGEPAGAVHIGAAAAMHGCATDMKHLQATRSGHLSNAPPQKGKKTLHSRSAVRHWFVTRRAIFCLSKWGSDGTRHGNASKHGRCQL